jgi:hypothetical protein
MGKYQPVSELGLSSPQFDQTGDLSGLNWRVSVLLLNELRQASKLLVLLVGTSAATDHCYLAYRTRCIIERVVSSGGVAHSSNAIWEVSSRLSLFLREIQLQTDTSHKSRVTDHESLAAARKHTERPAPGL